MFALQGGSVFAKGRASSITQWPLICGTINIEDNIDQLLSSFRCSVNHFPFLVLCHVSPHVRESKTLLDSGFHTVDSRFQLLDSRSFSGKLGFRIRIVSGIRDSYTCIPDSKAQDSRFHKQKFPRFRIPNAKFPGFRNPDSFTWGDMSMTGMAYDK